MARVTLALAAAAAAATGLVAGVAARDVPDTLKNFKKFITNRGQCNNVLAGGFHSADGDSGDFSYCGDFLDDYNIIYLQGKSGQLVNMDVDCDGAQNTPANDGRCGSSSDTQAETAFQYEVSVYNVSEAHNVTDLDAYIHPYVVFGNSGEKTKDWPTFDPTHYGVEPLSLMAVVCNDKLVYGIWGDTNGDDGDEAMVGEASISLATLCFGSKRINGNAGHDENDVLFIAFTGKDAVPGNKANWAAASADDFQKSIAGFGDDLVKRIGNTAARPAAGCTALAGAAAAAAAAVLLFAI